ncbi:flagellar basal body rod protein FlgB [Arenibaculum pallidiluteum]|uniref:flagellar basal body rod protein FlgB n=1 Tax=Arenibaculum pallidiluteum TaxID=2812559 RepID=UPI001A9615C0|nr:flagellar basal body rod protein FlgB [Arenibaculum pallidiluteum]
MDMEKLGLFRLIKGKMDWLSRRQEVVAQNIANADTPGFRPSDLTPYDFKSALRTSVRLPPARTDGSHLSGVSSDASGGTVQRERKTYETALDGNAVVLEEQLMKVAQSSADYQLATQIYRKNVAMLKLAIGRGGA